MSEIRDAVLIVGAGTTLERCAAIWRDSGVCEHLEVLSLESVDGFRRDLSPLSAFAVTQWRVYCALSGLGLNMARLKLMIDVRMAGYRLASFISPGAMVPRDWKVPDHTFISDGAVVEPSINAKHNLYVGPRAVVGFGTTVGHSVWVGTAATIGPKSDIGDYTVIGDNVQLADGMKVGRRCELLIPRLYRDPIADKTFFSPMFENPVRIYGP
jgi:acetyltransferase-like isoleucine patch superfamily enzyme